MSIRINDPVEESGQTLTQEEYYSALQRALPMVVNVKVIGGTSYPTCPVCKQTIKCWRDFPNFCSHCGQKFDWELLENDK